MLKNLAAISTPVIPFLFFPTQAQAITINLATGLDASNTLITTGAQSAAILILKTKEDKVLYVNKRTSV